MKPDAMDLRVRTKEFALQVVRFSTALPRNMTAAVLGRQLLRSGTSVGANYREAFRSRSDAEFVAKMGDCLKELEESAYWLELLAEAPVVPADQVSGLRSECDQLTAIFVTGIKRKKANMGIEVR